MQLTVNRLKPAPYNPRKITRETLQALACSLKEFGDISGIVWNSRTGHLVAGHQRVESLKNLYGENITIEDEAIIIPTGEKFPVRVVDWDETTERAANIAANSPTLMGEFTDGLDDILDALREDLPSFEQLGFDDLLADTKSLSEESVKLVERPLPEPVNMSWVLIGIPVVEFPSISRQIEEIADNESTVVETVVN